MVQLFTVEVSSTRLFVLCFSKLHPVSLQRPGFLMEVANARPLRNEEARDEEGRQENARRHDGKDEEEKGD